MLFWHLQRQLTKSRLTPMNPGAEVAVPEVLIKPSFFFFLPLKEYLFGICSVFWHLQQKLVVFILELLLGGWSQTELCL